MTQPVEKTVRIAPQRSLNTAASLILSAAIAPIPVLLQLGNPTSMGLFYLSGFVIALWSGVAIGLPFFFYSQKHSKKHGSWYFVGGSLTGALIALPLAIKLPSIEVLVNGTLCGGLCASMFWLLRIWPEESK